MPLGSRLKRLYVSDQIADLPALQGISKSGHILPAPFDHVPQALIVRRQTIPELRSLHQPAQSGADFLLRARAEVARLALLIVDELAAGGFPARRFRDLRASRSASVHQSTHGRQSEHSAPRNRRSRRLP